MSSRLNVLAFAVVLVTTASAHACYDICPRYIKSQEMATATRGSVLDLASVRYAQLGNSKTGRITCQFVYVTNYTLGDGRITMVNDGYSSIEFDGETCQAIPGSEMGYPLTRLKK